MYTYKIKKNLEPGLLKTLFVNEENIANKNTAAPLASSTSAKPKTTTLSMSARTYNR